MTDYTISSKLSNKTVYACYRGRFWYWNGSIWKESRIMTHRFELARAADKNLTPQAFLTNGAEFAPLDEYEIDIAMLDALENAKPCKNAPIDPVEEDSSSEVPAPCICSTCTCGGCKEECFGNCHSCGHPVQECNSYQTEGEKHLTPAHSADVDKPEVPGTQTTQDKPLTTVPDAMRPAFDYSGLTDQTVEDLHFAEDEYRHGKKMAERGLVHMGNAIAVAHDALCGVVAQCDNSKHGNRGDDTFRAWCVSIGITKDTAYRLLQVSALLDGSSPRQQKILKELSPTLLYAVAKPSAPAELVEKVKNGEVTTNKAYQDLLKENQQLRTERDKARADQLSTAKDCNRLGLKVSQEKDRADKAEAREEEARKAAHEYHEKYEEAAAMRATLLDQQGAYIADIDGLKKQNTKLKQIYRDEYESRIAANLQRQKAEGERDRAEERAKNAEDALKKQPITAVVDKEEVERQARKLFADMADEEVDRRAHQQAYSIAADMTEELKADKARLQKNMDELKQQLAEAQAVVPADLVADKETADSCYLNIDGIWGMALPSFQRLVGTGEDFNRAAGNLLQLCDHIHEELVKMTIANDKETLYD
jgi:hypothetical protein